MQKTYSKIIIILFLAIVLSSCKKESMQSSTIIIDCTGTYLRIDGKDYLVCNLEKVSNLSNGAVVKVSFNKIVNCIGSANVGNGCYLNHPNAGWIKVDKIK